MLFGLSTRYIISGEDSSKLETLINTFAHLKFKCTLFARHKRLLISPSVLEANGIRFTRIIQHPGEFVLSFSGTYHQGFNFGLNIAEAINFCSNRWLNFVNDFQICQCQTKASSESRYTLLQLRRLAAKAVHEAYPKNRDEKPLNSSNRKRKQRKKCSSVTTPSAQGSNRAQKRSNEEDVKQEKAEKSVQGADITNQNDNKSLSSNVIPRKQRKKCSNVTSTLAEYGDQTQRSNEATGSSSFDESDHDMGEDQKEENVKCPSCENKYKTKKSLGKHMRNKHGPTVKKYKCPVCIEKGAKFFTQPYTLQDHMSDVHKREMNLETAKDCLEVHSNTENPDKTPKIKTVRKKITCKCGIEVSGTSNYNRHLKKSCQWAKVQKPLKNGKEDRIKRPHFKLSTSSSKQTSQKCSSSRSVSKNVITSKMRMETEGLVSDKKPQCVTNSHSSEASDFTLETGSKISVEQTLMVFSTALDENEDHKSESESRSVSNSFNDKSQKFWDDVQINDQQYNAFDTTLQPQSVCQEQTPNELADMDPEFADVLNPIEFESVVDTETVSEVTTTTHTFSQNILVDSSIYSIEPTIPKIRHFEHCNSNDDDDNDESMQEEIEMEIEVKDEEETEEYYVEYLDYEEIADESTVYYSMGSIENLPNIAQDYENVEIVSVTPSSIQNNTLPMVVVTETESYSSRSSTTNRQNLLEGGSICTSQKSADPKSNVECEKDVVLEPVKMQIKEQDEEKIVEKEEYKDSGNDELKSSYDVQLNDSNDKQNNKKNQGSFNLEAVEMTSKVSEQERQLMLDDLSSSSSDPSSGEKIQQADNNQDRAGPIISEEIVPEFQKIISKNQKQFLKK